MTVISFKVYGQPAPAGSKTAGVTKDGRTFVRESSKASGPWKRAVAQVAGEAMAGGELLRGPLCLGVVFHVQRPKSHYGKRGLLPSAPSFPTVKPDATKLLRAVEDAMQGVVYANDSQIVEQTVAKYYGEPVRCEVTVRPLLTAAALAA